MDRPDYCPVCKEADRAMKTALLQSFLRCKPTPDRDIEEDTVTGTCLNCKAPCHTAVATKMCCFCARYASPCVLCQHRADH